MESSPARPDQTPARGRGRPGYDLESLLEVTVGVFNTRGFDGTSMEDLARELGITKSAIYHHVSGKDQLLELAIGRALDGLSEVVRDTRAIQASAAQRLEFLLRGSIRVLCERTPYVTLLLRVRGNTEVERRALERRRAFDHFVAELVSEAAAEGALRPDIEPELTARLLFGTVNSLAEWFRPGGDLGANELADAVYRVAFDGIRRSAAQPAIHRSRTYRPGASSSGG